MVEQKVKEILDKGLDYMSSEKSGDDGVTLQERLALAEAKVFQLSESA